MTAKDLELELPNPIYKVIQGLTMLDAIDAVKFEAGHGEIDVSHACMARAEMAVLLQVPSFAGVSRSDKGGLRLTFRLR